MTGGSAADQVFSGHDSLTLVSATSLIAYDLTTCHLHFMRILFIGDIFGQPGRRIVKETLPLLREELQPDLVLANAENAAAGFGITPALVEELLDLDIAVLTSGNHIWDKKEIYPYLRDQVNGRLLRPANYPADAPGHGLFVGKTPAGIGYAVINLQGRVFMPALDCPFRKADELLAQYSRGREDPHRGHARRGDLREASSGLVPRWAGDGCPGNAYACSHR